jgi:DNA-binding transcriptional LysR family regulator
MQDLNDLYYFSQVVEQGGFSAASRALGIPKSRLSRRIALLEERLGVRLLQRTTRRLRLTSAGERYLHYCLEMASSARAADDAMQQLKSEPSGRVTVSCPIAIAQQMLAPLLPEFMATWPDVDVQLLVTNRRVDLIKEGVDLALRVRYKLDTDPEMIVRRFGLSAGQMVASPGYLERHGMPQSPQDLTSHSLLNFAPAGSDAPWELHGPDNAHLTVPVHAKLTCDDFVVLVEAAVRGRGIALLPTVSCESEIRRGQLIRVLPDWHCGEGIVHCLYPSRHGMTPAVRALLEFFSERLPPIYARNPGHDTASQIDLKSAATLSGQVGVST